MATLTVTTTTSKGAGSLIYEINHANSGDTIVFASALKNDTITTLSTLDIKSIQNLTIDGGADNITLSGGGVHTVFQVESTASVTFDNLTIANGVGTGSAATTPSAAGGSAAGGIYDMGSVTLKNDSFVSDSATGGAGKDASTYYGIGGGAGGGAAGGIYVASGGFLNVNSTDTFGSTKATADVAKGGKGGFGGYGTNYYGGGSYVKNGAPNPPYAYAPKGSGAGGAGGSETSTKYSLVSKSVWSVSNAHGAQGAQGATGAGYQGGSGGNSGMQGSSNTYYYMGVLTTATGGGGGGGAAYADFGGGGTIVCYLRGTLILGEQGSVRVEEVKIGDGVVTGSGEVAKVKWIGRSRYAGWAVENNEDIQPIQFKVGSIADNVPNRDLFVSPEHAMFIDGVLIPARNLINGVSVVRAAPMEEVSYFHLELDRHAVIFAEGALAETFVDDDSRDLFQNAAEFTEMYPDAAPLVAEYCAPRVESGYKLEAVRRSLMGRAVRLLPDGSAAHAPVMTGNVDLVSRVMIEGWAYMPDLPQSRVPLSILDGGVVIGQVVADHYRADLAGAGVGDGRHGFSFVVPFGFSEEGRHEVEVRRDSDWSLVGSIVVLPAESLEIVSAFSSAIGPDVGPVLLA